MKKTLKKQKMKNMLTRLQVTAIMVIGCSATIFAQAADRTNKVRSALTSTTSVVSGIVDTVAGLIYVVCAIVGLINGVKLFQAIQAGETDAQKKAGAWFGGCIVLILGVYFLKAMFIN